MPAATCRKPAVRRFSRTARQLSVPLAADVRGSGTIGGSRGVTDVEMRFGGRASDVGVPCLGPSQRLSESAFSGGISSGEF